jgi:hypothetical protein
MSAWNDFWLRLCAIDFAIGVGLAIHLLIFWRTHASSQEKRKLCLFDDL